MATVKIDARFGVIALMIVLAAFSRLIPHPANFAPIGAMALFGAAHFRSRWAAFLVPLLAFWLSDLAVNNILYAQYNPSFVWFYSGFYWVYGATALTTCLGFLYLKKVKFFIVLGSSIASAFLFFVITNFGVWASGSMYPHDLGGLIACYVAGIPFYGGTLAGNLFYSMALFGGFSFLQYKFPALQSVEARSGVRI